MIVTSEYILNKIAPPSLPTPPGEYDPRYVEQFNNVLRLYFNRLNGLLGQLTAGTGIIDGSNLQFPNGAFHQDGHTTLTVAIPNPTSTADITVASTDGFLSAAGLIIGTEIITYTGKTPTTFTGVTRSQFGTSGSSHAIGSDASEAQVITPPALLIPVVFTVTDTSNAVSIDPTDNSKVVFAVSGYYNIQFSAQILNYTTAEDNVTMWFRKDGVDIPNTAGVVTVAPKHGSKPGSVITSWNLVVDVTAGQYIQLMITSDTGNSVVATYPPGTAPGPVHPTSPSIILTATFVSALY